MDVIPFDAKPFKDLARVCANRHDIYFYTVSFVEDANERPAMPRSVVPAPLATHIRTAQGSHAAPRYVVAPVAPLPCVNGCITLGSRLFGHERNTRFLLLVSRWERWLYGFFSLASASCCAMFYAQSNTLGSLLGGTTFVLNIPVSMALFVPIVWDVAWLNIHTFEFWFLTMLNWIGMFACYVILADGRIWAIVSMALLLQAIIAIDGNAHTRRFLIRVAALAPPGVMIGLTPCALHYTPRLVLSGIALGNGHQVDIFDVIIHCYSSLTIFVAAKVFRSRHLIKSSAVPITTVPCEVFFPRCHLLPRRSYSSKYRQHAQSRSGRHRMEFVHATAPPVIDGNNLLIGIPWPRCLGAIVTLVGCGGAIIGWVTTSWYVVHTHILLRPLNVQLTLAVVSCAISLMCFAFYLFNAQRVLLMRYIGSLDAWFITFQFTIVTLVVSDVVYWDERIWFVWTAWIWCHWCILEDTLTPISRRQLIFHRPLALAVHVGLLVYPPILIYWIFFSNGPQLRNRIFFQVTFFGSEISMEAYSMVLSRIVTIWIWMGRFLWREMFYPVDAFKLLKFRVQYHYSAEHADIPTEAACQSTRS